MSNLKIGAKTFCISLKSYKDFNELCVNTGLIDEKNVKFTDGFIDFYNQIIYVRDDLHKDVQASCLLNNILQIVSIDSGIEELSGTPLQSMTQVIVSMLTPRLLQVLRDNQETLLKYGITNSL
jgi:hypothetical protein